MTKAIDRLRGLSAAQRAALLAAAKATVTNPVAGQPLTARSRPDGRSIASYTQEQQWFLDRISPDQAAAYLVPFALRLRGVLDVPALRDVLAQIIQRHEVLRCRFELDGGEVRQIVEADVEVPLVVEAVKDEESLWRRARELATERFELTKAPLLRTVLLSLNERDNVLVWIAHHAVADGFSIAVLLDELRAGYQRELPPLPLQFADFAEWQRERLTDERLAGHVDFWRTHLAGAPPATLPTDHPRPGVPSFRGAAVPFDLGPTLSAGISAVSQRVGVTPFVVLLTALHIVLARYNGEHDAVLGVAVAGRERSEVESLIGPFSGTIPVRIDASGDPTLAALLAAVSSTVLDGLSHQEVPFGHLVRSLGKARDASRNPLYDVLFSMDALATTGETRIAPDLTVQPSGLPNGTARLDLQLTVEQNADALGGRLDYSTDLYETLTVQGIVDSFKAVLEEIVADVDRPLSTVSLLDPATRARTLDEWHRPTGASPKFLDMFTELVLSEPDRSAVSQNGRTVTYRELDEWSNQFANAIVKRGGGSGAVVAVAIDRTIAIVAAIIGILKSGSVYLPLDPSYPDERLDFMLTDSSTRILLHESGVADGLLGRVHADLELGEIAVEPVTPVDAPAHQVAYVMYTSGSTGKPKGVAIGHTALGNFLSAMTSKGLMRHNDVVIALTNTTFDISMDELLLPLVCGGSIVMARRSEARSGEALRRLIDEHEVTVLHGTPSTCQLLIDTGWQGASVRRVLCGGEAMSAKLAADLQERVPEVWNVFGPTEATVWALVHRVEGDGRPPIGKPLANYTALVLDDRLRPVPPGVLGELYLGGVGLAEEYLNLPELTAQRFITDTRGKRLYRTGDLASYDTDGVFHFHGRLDHQVKLRGFRIELGEIEAALVKHPAVLEAVALIHNASENDSRLIAFVRLAEDATERALQAAVQATLPAHMVPSRVVRIDAFPLTSSGKVDRRALLNSPIDAGDGPEEWDPPVTPTERWVAQCWEELLGDGRKIGRTDNFFLIGGHSLLAVKILATIQDVYGVQPSLEGFFAVPTVTGLSELLLAAPSLADDALLAQVEGLTDEEVAALIAAG
ncbi:amino acid adenylation domain-containing protein [Kibdelosporangium philippinense]|uniref:Amino acid adenylation domain-containing protein n=1 Tax=Kibdelosporangium philippinense TaxID=211113 RepID=A0ABS8Z313_9PSEU|nr:non-ribosomal peptide synthetase [Kibdelosporangium philippinense]MCE7002318.1 amino acid adenylation domain-containing protein [Kibdelosporangium philippinense]